MHEPQPAGRRSRGQKEEEDYAGRSKQPQSGRTTGPSLCDRLNLIPEFETSIIEYMR